MYDSRKTVVHALLALYCTVATTSVFAQPSQAEKQALINAAADRINTLTPQALPEQRVSLGTFDGARNEIYWEVPLVNIPDYKRDSEGGYVKPLPKVTLNSFNVTYDLGVVNASVTPEIALFVPGTDGEPERIEATLSSAGDTASLSFNVHAQGPQSLVIEYAGKKQVFTIYTHLREQLGAFVVPHMLIAIVYEPPGPGSSAYYSSSSTVGSVVSWGFAESSGIVKETGVDWRNELARELEFFGAKLGLEALCANLGLSICQNIQLSLSDLWDHGVYLISEKELEIEDSHGLFYTVTQEFGTALHMYPGQGDRFIILTDVLFIYAVHEGEVKLSPVGFSDVLGPAAVELHNHLPPEVAEELRGLDPLLSPVVAKSRLPDALNPTINSRFTKLEHPIRCESGVNTTSFRRDEFSAELISSVQVNTRLERTTGIIASILGEPAETYQSVRHWSTTQQISGETEEAGITLRCDLDDQFYVDVYFDTVFRTFLAVRGEPIGDEPTFAGRVVDSRGLALRGVSVVLDLDGRRYMTETDRNGEFSFSFASLPNTTGVLEAAGQTIPLSYHGSPIVDLYVVRRPQQSRRGPQPVAGSQY